MARRATFKDVVAERSRRIAAEARARARTAAGGFAPPGEAPPWLSTAMGYLPDGVRRVLRDALGPDERAEHARALLAAARREKHDLRLREQALDTVRADLDRSQARLDEARAELSAREREAERLLARARRAAKEAAVERRVPLADIVWDRAESPRPIRGVARLAANIKRFGQLTPIVARPAPDGLRLVTGYRRLAALESAAATHVRVRVIDDLDDATAAALYVAENALVDGVSSNAVRQLAERLAERAGFAEILPLIEADDEAVVEEVYLDDMAEEARHHLAEGAAWVSTLRDYWDDLEPGDRAPLESLIVYFAKVAGKLAR